MFTNEIFYDMERNNPIDLRSVMIDLENLGVLNYLQGEQADCAELFDFIINSLQEVCDCDIFTFSEMNIELCFVCNHTEKSNEISNMLRIHCFRHSHTIDLTDLISNEFGNRSVKCRNFENSNHVKNICRYITLLPMILIIHLERIDKEGEILDRCHLPMILKSSLFTTQEVNEHEYQLSSVICHLGKDKKGHFVCYIRCGSLWARCDDEEIKYIENINNIEVMKHSYLIGYELKEK